MRRLNDEKIFEIIWNRTEIVFPLSGRVYFQYYRDKKILKSFYCSPCSPAWLLGADTLCSGVMSIVSAILVAAVAIIVLVTITVVCTAISLKTFRWE